MTIKHPHQPPTYGVTHRSVERTAAGEPPASETLNDDDREKTAAKPANKAAAKPANKAAPAKAEQ